MGICLPVEYCSHACHVIHDDWWLIPPHIEAVAEDIAPANFAKD